MKSILLPLAAVAVVVVIFVFLQLSALGSPPTGYSAGPTLPGGTLELQQTPTRKALVVSGSMLKSTGFRPYIVIDRYCNLLYLRTKDSVYLAASCSTGSNGELIDSLTGRRWKFSTPAGIFAVHSKVENPWWRKPDWAFVEEGLPLPKRESERFDNEMMGDYAIGFGDGYFIHGTIYERLLGRSVTHGCIRLGAQDLKSLYNQVDDGTLIFIY